MMTVPVRQMWLKGFGLLVLVQQSFYWGYRMGRDKCLFGEDCHAAPDDYFMNSYSRATTSKSKRAERNLDVTPDSLPPVRRGIVLSSQCSGSEFVVSSLNSIPGVTWHLERMIHYSKTYMNDAEWEKVRWEKYLADLEESFTFPSTKGDRNPEVTPPDTSGRPVMVGFKLMYDQIPQHLRLPFAKWLEEHQVHVVHLRRKCAALQWASQMDKFMRQHRHKIKKDHVYSKEEADSLAATKNWEITLQDETSQNRANRWVQNVKTLEANQEDFARYLHIYAAKTPVFEITYENVDGPFQENWFNSLFSFLGFDHRYSKAASKTIKTGSRQCEDRIAGLGGQALPMLDQTNSQTECLRMRSLAVGSGNSTAPVSSSSLPDLNGLLLPPEEGRCRLGPNCLQREYAAFQDQLLKKSKK